MKKKMKEYEELQNEIDQGKKNDGAKSILITGGTGSFGKAFIKNIIAKRNQKVSNF